MIIEQNGWWCVRSVTAIDMEAKKNRIHDLMPNLASGSFCWSPAPDDLICFKNLQDAQDYINGGNVELMILMSK